MRCIYYKFIFLVLFFFLESKSEAFVVFRVPSSGESIMNVGSYSQDFLNLDESENFRIMIWNTAERRNSFWKEEFLAFSENADIILIQEIAMDEKEILSFFESEVSHGFRMAFSFFRSKSNRKTGVAIGSRVRPSSFSFTRSLNKELLWRTPKNISFATFQLCQEGCDDVLVVNAHMLWLSSFQAYIGQLEEIKKVVRSHKGPVIVAGDFNTWYKKRAHHMEDSMKSLGLSRVVFKNKKGVTHPLTRMALDHIFVSESLEEVRSSIGHSYSSDHRPLFVTLRLSKEHKENNEELVEKINIQKTNLISCHDSLVR